MNARRPVLVVDDDEDIREVVAMTLETTGYRVEVARDGLDAMERLSAGLRPSLILLDMMMPRMDGEGFLIALRRDPDLAGIPVVLLSAHTAARKKAQELHADGYLVKPVDIDTLLGTVNRFAARPSANGSS
jgi:CheY-like chemotaxis protein